MCDGVASFASAREEIGRLKRELDVAEQRLEERGRFLAVMSHELREPMNGVLGMARLLRDTRLDDEQQGYVDAVIGSAEALITLVNDILDLSKIDSGRFDLNPVDFAIRPFFERLAQPFYRRAVGKGIGFALDLGSSLPELVHGDPGRIRQIVTNLVGNSLKFTSKGEVRLSVSTVEIDTPDRFGLMLEVSDTGIGIPEEYKARVFSPFAQADVQTARLYGGSGLGLLIAKRLAALMCGEVELARSDSSGTVFNVRLELQRPSDRELRRTRATIAGTRLLIADAQTRPAQIMAELAKLWGLEVRQTASAAEAMTVLQEAADRGAPFDFAIVDRGLPDKRGDELAPVIRSTPRLRELKLVLLVAAGVRGDAADAKGLGFDGYLRKPVTASTLLDGLQQLHGSTNDGEFLTIHSVSERRGRPLNLLIADDNPVNCKLTGIMLQKAGHSVETVANGAEAIAAVSGGDFDAVLMDVQMPVMGGLEATRRIRQLEDPSRANLPIIAITANAMRGDDETCFAAGMSGYVTKPIDRGALLSTLETLTIKTSAGAAAAS